MLLENSRQQVLPANLEVVRRGLALYTFGNASRISPRTGSSGLYTTSIIRGSMAGTHITFRLCGMELTDGGRCRSRFWNA